MPALAPYIPATDSGFDLWDANFASLITATPPLYGLTAAEALVVQDSFESWHAAYVLVTSPDTKTKSTVADKNTAKVNALAIQRPFAQRIALNPGVLSGDKVALGLNPRTSMPAPITPPDTFPVLTVQSAASLSIILRYRDSAASVKVKAKPYGVTRMRLLGSVASVRAVTAVGMPLIGDFTKSPFQVIFGSEDGGKVFSCVAQWVTRTGGVSPLSSIVSFTVPAS